MGNEHVTNNRVVFIEYLNTRELECVGADYYEYRRCAPRR